MYFFLNGSWAHFQLVRIREDHMSLDAAPLSELHLPLMSFSIQEV